MTKQEFIELLQDQQELLARFKDNNFGWNDELEEELYKIERLLKELN